MRRPILSAFFLHFFPLPKDKVPFSDTSSTLLVLTSFYIALERRKDKCQKGLKILSTKKEKHKANVYSYLTGYLFYWATRWCTFSTSFQVEGYLKKESEVQAVGIFCVLGCICHYMWKSSSRLCFKTSQDVLWYVLCKVTEKPNDEK